MALCPATPSAPNIGLILHDISSKIDIMNQKIDKQYEEQLNTRDAVNDVCIVVNEIMYKNAKCDPVYNFKFPIDTEELLQEYEHNIIKNKQFRKRLVQHLRLNYKTGKRMMKLFDYSLLNNFSSTGYRAKNKKPFLDLCIAEVMKESCSPDQVKKFENDVRVYLKHAGYLKRKNKIKSEDEYIS